MRLNPADTGLEQRLVAAITWADDGCNATVPMASQVNAIVARLNALPTMEATPEKLTFETLTELNVARTCPIIAA